MLDFGDILVLICKNLILFIVDQHCRIGLKHHDPAIAANPAINAAIIETGRSGHCPKRILMRCVENIAYIFEKALFFLPHPGMVCHVGAKMVDLPIVVNGEMIRQYFAIHENHPIFAKQLVV